MKSTLKKFLKQSPALWNRLVQWRSERRIRDYRLHRERYATSAFVAGNRTLSFPTRSLGEIHTFAAIPMWSWHEALLPDLAELGPVTHFDYSLGKPEEDGWSYNRAFFEWRERLNRELLREFEVAHAKRPIDWLFAYAQGNHVLAETVLEIRRRHRIPTVNMSLDDKNSWNLGVLRGQIDGSQGLVSAFDLWWTSASITVDWVNKEGGYGVYMPEGFTTEYYPAEEMPYEIPVSFVGMSYGPRSNMIDYLKSHDVPVQVYGHGWGDGSSVSRTRMVEIYRTSQINIGHGGMSGSEELTNVKGRDFEIPCAGGGVYITTFNPDLARHFRIGEEILCWHSYDDLLEQIRYYLTRPELCRDMARRARARCLSEHRWLHRYKHLLGLLGVLEFCPDDQAPGFVPSVPKAER